MKITAIRRQKKQNDRVNIYLDGEFAFALSEEVALKAGLRKGQAIDEKRRAELDGEDAFWRSREAALVLLSHRARSERELVDRLLRRGFELTVAEKTVATLRERGLVDDLAFARAFVRDRLRTRPSGRPRLLAELRRKGVSAADAERTIAEIAESSEEGELDLARRALAKFPNRRNEEALKTKRRLYAYLARRGFSSGVISELSREHFRSDD